MTFRQFVHPKWRKHNQVCTGNPQQNSFLKTSGEIRIFCIPGLIVILQNKTDLNWSSKVNQLTYQYPMLPHYVTMLHIINFEVHVHGSNTKTYCEYTHLHIVPLLPGKKKISGNSVQQFKRSCSDKLFNKLPKFHVHNGQNFQKSKGIQISCKCAHTSTDCVIFA